MKSQLYIEYSPLRYLGEKDSDLFTNNEEPAYAVPSPFLRQPFPSSFFVALAPSSFLEVCLPLKGGRDYLPLFNLLSPLYVYSYGDINFCPACLRNRKTIFFTASNGAEFLGQDRRGT